MTPAKPQFLQAHDRKLSAPPSFGSGKRGRRYVRSHLEVNMRLHSMAVCYSPKAPVASP